MSESSLKKNNVVIGSDHAGYSLKMVLMDHIQQMGYEISDIGTHSLESVDYPDVAQKLCHHIENSKNILGILICGTGIGMSIAANRFPFIRAALCQQSYDVEMAREHNNANVLCLGARVIGEGVAKSCVDTFLKTSFSQNASHQRRVAMLG